jgi:hypothetical protein
MARKTMTLDVKVLIEVDDERAEGTKHYVANAVKGSCRNVRDSSVAIAVYDNGNLVGLDASGNPSDDFEQFVKRTFYGGDHHEGTE